MVLIWRYVINLEYSSPFKKLIGNILSPLYCYAQSLIIPQVNCNTYRVALKYFKTFYNKIVRVTKCNDAKSSALCGLGEVQMPDGWSYVCPLSIKRTSVAFACFIFSTLRLVSSCPVITAFYTLRICPSVPDKIFYLSDGGANPSIDRFLLVPVEQIETYILNVLCHHLIFGFVHNIICDDDMRVHHLC
jgi:hypothetical protein